MQKVCMLLLLCAIFAIGLSSPTGNVKPQSDPLQQPEFAEIEQTVVLDLMRNLVKEIFEDIDLPHPLRSLFTRMNDFLQNDFDPEGSQTTQLKFVVSIMKELLDYLQSVIPTEGNEMAKDQFNM